MTLIIFLYKQLLKENFNKLQKLYKIYSTCIITNQWLSYIYRFSFVVENICIFRGLLCNCKGSSANFCMWILWKLINDGNHKHFSWNEGQDMKQWKSSTANEKLTYDKHKRACVVSIGNLIISSYYCITKSSHSYQLLTWSSLGDSPFLFIPGHNGGGVLLLVGEDSGSFVLRECVLDCLLSILKYTISHTCM